MNSAKSGNILIVDDNQQILSALTLLLKNEFNLVRTIRNPELLPSLLQSESFDIILLDMNFRSGVNNGNEGFYWLKEIKRYDPQVLIIMITAYGDIELAVRAIREGAADFIPKPWNAEKLLITLNAALDLSLARKEVMKLQTCQKLMIEDQKLKFQMITGTSPAMELIYKTIAKVAQTMANVLILGENGTGKEYIARAIHQASKRSGEIFLGVDLASLNENLFESEIFGHMKGAFTDAREDRPGRFETASGGTLFLDEIGNLSLSMQGKLLTVLQNREVTRIGSNKPRKVDIRLISATNKNLETMVAENTFREDLYYRMNTIRIELPPLRNRQEDIPVLAAYFLKNHADHYNKGPMELSRAALHVLQTYTWPGNIRELDHTLEKAVILCDSSVIQPQDLFLKDKKHSWQELTMPRSMEEIEKMAILKALEQFDRNLSRAAQVLGISRTTLYSKMARYNIEYHGEK